MTHTDNTLSLPLSTIKIALGSLIALSLLGCDGLARFTAKPDKKAEAVVAVEEPAEPAPIPASKEKEPVEKPKKAPLYEWNGDGRSVTRIVINTNEQKARFYADNEEIGWATVATGVSKHPTPTGQFEVMEKVANKRSNLYGKVVKNGKVVKRSVKVGRDSIPAGGTFQGAKMPYFMRLTYDGVGLHAGPIPRPGSPASHGCIRMPSKFAPLAFKHVSEGTSVEIVGKGPSYGDYVAKQRAIAAKRAAERKRVAAAKQPTKQAAKKPVTTSVAKSTPAAAPAAAAGTVAAAAAVTQTAQAKDSSAAAQTLETSPPRETHMRAPAEDSAENPVAAQQSAPTVTQEPAPSAPEPSVETAQAQAPTPAPKDVEPPAPADSAPQPVAAEPTPSEVAAPKPAKPAEPTQIAAPTPAQEATTPVVEKPAAAPKPEASVPAAPAPAASAPPPPAADAG